MLAVDLAWDRRQKPAARLEVLPLWLAATILFHARPFTGMAAEAPNRQPSRGIRSILDKASVPSEAAGESPSDGDLGS